MFPPGSAPLPAALRAHAEHRTAWYRDLVGPLLLPAEEAEEVLALGDYRPTIGLIGELARLRAYLAAGPGCPVRQVESATAKRGEDPAPGLAALIELAVSHPEVDVYAEIPLTWGLLAALDRIAEERTNGVRIAPKFRTGGLAAELFPTPVELAAVICACRDRELPFKLTAGLHRAIRHLESETGFVHHGFLNVLAATIVAAEGAEVAPVADLLGTTDPVPLVEAVRPYLSQERPLWIGFGSCSIGEPLADLGALNLVPVEGAR